MVSKWHVVFAVFIKFFLVLPTEDLFSDSSFPEAESLPERVPSS